MNVFFTHAELDLIWNLLMTNGGPNSKEEEALKEKLLSLEEERLRLKEILHD